MVQVKRRFIYTERYKVLDASIYTQTLVLANINTWSWGDNTYGQLGDTTKVCKCIPNSILGAKKTFCKISAYYYNSAGIDNNGLVWTWGNNVVGQLGDNSTICRSTPVSISGVKKTFCNINAGTYFMIATDKNGTLWGWGSNTYGQTGDGSGMNRSTPVSVKVIKKTFCKISAGYDHSHVIDKNGQVWGWGYNNYGKLGIFSSGYAGTKLTPVSILGAKKTFCEIAAGQWNSGAIDKNGQVWTWGDNAWGQLGNFANVAKSTPISIAGVKKTFCQITIGYGQMLAIDKGGLVWSWGFNNYGQGGDNTQTSRLTPVSILGNKKTFCKIVCLLYSTLAIDKYGQLWGWGWNNYGQLGNNEITDRYTPVKISGI